MLLTKKNKQGFHVEGMDKVSRLHMNVANLLRQWGRIAKIEGVKDGFLYWF